MIHFIAECLHFRSRGQSRLGGLSGRCGSKRFWTSGFGCGLILEIMEFVVGFYGKVVEKSDF
jgi:hypothetical protein